MFLTFLGTGGAFTDFRVNYHNNLLVDCGTSNVLIDCGGTAVQSVKELGIKPWEIDGVIVTHLHGDHIAGIEQLLWERFYTGPSGPGFQQTHIYSTQEILDGLRACVSPCVDEFTDKDGGTKLGGYDALVIEHAVDSARFKVGDLSFALRRTPHVEAEGVSKPSYGVEIHSNDAEVYYTSDTTFRGNIGELFPVADIIFHDCTFSPLYPGTVHTHYEELLTLPDDVRARIVLMHHTAVPEEVFPIADGFMGAAERHQTFAVR